MVRILIAIIFLCAGSTHAFAEGTVIASIKPLHALVAGVMEGDDTQPLLLVDGKQSLHHFSLKPSQLQALSKADIVFYIADRFETFLPKALADLPGSVYRAPMEKIEGMALYPVRMSGAFEGHSHDESEHGHDNALRVSDAADFHIWTSPANAKLIVANIASVLSARYPAKKALYAHNAERLLARLESLDMQLAERMRRLSGKPFVVFHDASQYFEKSYALTNAGSITVHPQQAISAKHLSEVRGKIKQSGATCVLREPQFDGKVVDNLIEGTGAHSGEVDAEGALLAPGPELYFQLIEGLAHGLEACLAPV